MVLEGSIWSEDSVICSGDPAGPVRGTEHILFLWLDLWTVFHRSCSLIHHLKSLCTLSWRWMREVPWEVESQKSHWREECVCLDEQIATWWSEVLLEGNLEDFRLRDISIVSIFYWRFGITSVHLTASVLGSYMGIPCGWHRATSSAVGSCAWWRCGSHSSKIQLLLHFVWAL